MNRWTVYAVVALAIVGLMGRVLASEMSVSQKSHGRWLTNTVTVTTLTSGNTAQLATNNTAREYLRIIVTAISTTPATSYLGQTALNTSSLNFQDSLSTDGTLNTSGSITYPNNAVDGTKSWQPVFAGVYSPASTATFVVIEGYKP